MKSARRGFHPAPRLLFFRFVATISNASSNVTRCSPGGPKVFCQRLRQYALFPHSGNTRTQNAPLLHVLKMRP
jgi:hypothetical protein